MSPADGLHHWSKPTKHELCCGDAYYLERVTSYDLADRAGVETDSVTSVFVETDIFVVFFC